MVITIIMKNNNDNNNHGSGYFVNDNSNFGLVNSSSLTDDNDDITKMPRLLSTYVCLLLL